MMKSAQNEIGSVHACKIGYVVSSLLNRRYAMEQNVDPTTAGDQESGWLYSRTNSQNS